MICRGGAGLLCLFAIVHLTACANFGHKLKAFLNGKSMEEMNKAKKKKRDRITYEDRKNLIRGPRREYNRVTEEDLKNRSHLDEKAGSLWVNEGQGAYLFSENVLRMVGDPITVKLEGDPKDQLESKVGVIKDLLSRLKKGQNKPQQRGPAANRQGDDGQNNQQEQGGGSEAPKDSFDVKNVSARVTKRMADGNYRIKGSQPFMIGRREYKVIVTGIVRSSDFNESGVSATKLLDPKFDIVSMKKEGKAQ